MPDNRQAWAGGKIITPYKQYMTRGTWTEGRTLGQYRQHKQCMTIDIWAGRRIIGQYRRSVRIS